MGLGQIEIGNIDLNLFRGKLLLEEVALYRSAARVLSLQHAELDLSMLSLLEQRLHIQSIAVHGLEVTIRQNANQPLQVAGISMPSSEQEAQPTADPKTPSNWSLGIDSLVIADSAIHVIHPRFPESLLIHSLSSGPLAMWRPDYVTPIDFRLGLREGELRVAAKTSPFASEPVHSAELVIAALPLESFAKLAEPQLSALSGTLSTQVQITLQQDEAKRLSFTQQGSLSLADLKLQSGHSLVTQQGMSWKGSTEMRDVTDINTLRLQGELEVAATGLSEEGQAKPALSLHSLNLSGVTLQGSKQLVLKEVAIDGLVAEAIRQPQGFSLQGLPSPATPAEGKRDTATQPEQKPETVNAEPFQFRIEQLSLSGENRFTFNDQTVKPAFRQTLILTEVNIQDIDSSKPEQATKLMVKGKDDNYTRFTVEGGIRPFASQLTLNLKAKLENLDLPPTSPYLAQLLGYRITTGQLNSNVAMQIDRNTMNGEIDLRMNQLRLEQEDPARMENFQSKLSVPLNTALSLLRDKDDNIKLTLPVSGKLDDPKFNLNDIISTALGKAMKSASVSYLKHLLQPYGSLITVLQLAGKASGGIQLDPIAFTVGSAELSAEATPYIEKISQLMSKKGINMQLCGFATAADLVAITKGKVKEISAEGHPALEALAKQRAESIKSVLVNNYGVLPKQLFICHPELERGNEATPRVELSI